MTEIKEGFHTCEWCKMQYPIGMEIYYQIHVFEDTHIICGDCHAHLHKLVLREKKEGEK